MRFVPRVIEEWFAAEQPWNAWQRIATEKGGTTNKVTAHGEKQQLIR